LPALIANYNTRPSRALDAAGKHLAPAVGPKEQKLRETDIVRAAEVRKLIDESGVGPGAKVRLLYARTKAGSKDKFAKSHENLWTTEIYNVLSRVGPNSFLVEVPAGEIPVWPFHSLQVVRKEAGEAVPG